MGDPVIDKTMAIRIATQLGWEPVREWQGLTDDEKEDVLKGSKNAYDAIERIEAKLKEKNT